jgi:hypothetical protein
MSGFESVAEWNNAIDDLHDGVNGCGLYLVGESKNVDTVAELLQIVPVYGIKRQFEGAPLKGGTTPLKDQLRHSKAGLRSKTGLRHSKARVRE